MPMMRKRGSGRGGFGPYPAQASPAMKPGQEGSWKTGGAPTWLTGSFDAELNLIYWGTGNPGPTWVGGVRKGDNLYSDSVIALDADTGDLKWHF